MHVSTYKSPLAAENPRSRAAQHGGSATATARRFLGAAAPRRGFGASSLPAAGANADSISVSVSLARPGSRASTSRLRPSSPIRRPFRLPKPSPTPAPVASSVSVSAATAPAAVPAAAAAAASRAEPSPRPFPSLLAPPSLFRSSVLLGLGLRLLLFRRASSFSFCLIAERRARHWGPGSQLTPPEGPAARGHLFLDRRLPGLQSAIHCVASHDGAVLGGQCPGKATHSRDSEYWNDWLS
ncbi:hypothetical protein MUK42_26723 [Musa troglodytarum]|uniref:Uncharacterized protein n=1 Tax=Musa troglodytarum TaxID=320322 RepID=A0A9E7F4K4_9LILI|nr:hypothetical protein MUK42_26723 [Musa troglodytarum]